MYDFFINCQKCLKRQFINNNGGEHLSITTYSSIGSQRNHK